MEYCLSLKLASSSVITCCPQHFLGNKSYTDLLERIRSCFVCKQMITQLVTTSVAPEQQPQTLARQRARQRNVLGSVQAARLQPTKEYVYGGHCHFDEELVTLLQGMNKVACLPSLSSLTFGSTPSFRPLFGPLSTTN